MAEVFTRQDTVEFVGGRGDGIANAAGCIKSFYDTYIAPAGNLAAIMGANGGYLAQDAAGTYTTGTGVIANVPNTAAVAIEGQCIYTDGAALFPGIYEILSVNSGSNEITIVAGLGSDTITVNLGGAFDSHQNAIDETSATLKNLWILTNKDEALNPGLAISQGGDLGTNSHLYLWGFYENPPTNLFEPTGDMDYGGAYYKSALDILNQRGLAYHTLGGEEVENGDFTDDISSWNTFGSFPATKSYEAVIGNPSGSMKITRIAGSGFEGAKQIILTIGRTYSYSVDVYRPTGSDSSASVSGNVVTPTAFDTWETKTGTFTATSTELTCYSASGSIDAVFYFDNVSVKEVLIPAKVRLSVSTATDLFTITNGENIHFRNLDLVGHTSWDIFNFSGTMLSGIVINCSINTYSELIGGSDSNHFLFIDSYIGTPATEVKNTTGDGSGYICCIFDLADKDGILDQNWFVNNCLFVDGVTAIRVGSRNQISNCTFYNQSVSSIRMNSSFRSVNMINNIFLLQAGANVVNIIGGNGSLGQVYNNVYYGTDGNSLAMPFNSNSVAFTPFGGGNIEEDPQFVSVTPGSYDFRSRNPRVLRGGQQTIAGDPTQMGAVLQKHQFDLRNLS